MVVAGVIVVHTHARPHTHTHTHHKRLAQPSPAHLLGTVADLVEECGRSWRGAVLVDGQQLRRIDPLLKHIVHAHRIVR